MNEKHTNGTTGQKQGTTEQPHQATKDKMGKPAWWNDSLQTSWKKVSASTLAAWDKSVQAEKKLEHHIAEEALAFGHGAREAYPKMLVWNAELEDKLKADWKSVQSNASEAWDHVHSAVKHSWEAAKRDLSSAAHGTIA